MAKEKKEKTEKNLEKQAENKPKRDEKGRLLPGYSGNPKGRQKGLRDWKTDINEAIKIIAKQTGKKPSEIRTDLLVRGIGEARRGNYNFWKEVIERSYGKMTQPIEGEIFVPGAKELADKLQSILDEETD